MIHYLKSNKHFENFRYFKNYEKFKMVFYIISLKIFIFNTFCPTLQLNFGFYGGVTQRFLS